MEKKQIFSIVFGVSVFVCGLFVITNACTAKSKAKPMEYGNSIKTITDTLIIRDTVYANNNEYGKRLDDWQILIMAIMHTESHYNEKVTNGNQTGCLQITPIYVKELNRIAGTHYTIKDALSMEKSLDMFLTMNDFKNPTHSIEKAISLHNRGTAYRNKVMKEFENIKKYEQARDKMIDNEKIKEYEKTRNKLVGLYSECD